MVRGITGVLVGAVVWIVGFYALAILLGTTWPEYRAHGRVWQDEFVFTFTTTMACFNLLFWALAAVGAGWTAMKIARRREAVWVLAGLLELYIVALHIVLFWSSFPWWYNLGVIIPAIPAVLLGAKLAEQLPAATRTAAT